ncbi:MAG TPA: efflux RND transporter periplasmic adaptor subunit [Peptococcaceae bacterium]|nr:efflux RND transporter periplasmic adaptor subunit [Peptococcaceae bacterium]HPZ71172.1 efflux RND transporter periplasmic adaptor subunit [Peptococcaceae bacterium]HQD54482.1 efflux RND transporter periplasmic adaptor subunit [Peptococcaceae bacterium]
MFKNIKKKKALVIVILCVISVAVVGYFMTTQNRKPRFANADASNYLTVRVQRGDIIDLLEGSGSLQPTERYTLTSKNSGTVQEIYVTEGTQVKKGQPLLKIKNTEVEIKAQQAQLEWEIARNDLISLDNPTGKKLFEIRSSELKVEECKTALQKKLDEKEKLTIKAPFSGKIIDTEIAVGEEVSKGDPALTIATSDQMEVVARFPAHVISSFSTGMKANIFVTGLGKTYKGTIKEIEYDTKDSDDDDYNTVTNRSSRNNTTSSGDYLTIISLEKPDADLKPGMETFNTVYIASDPDQDVFLYKQATGYLRYAQSERIKIEVNGTVEKIHRPEGAKVFEGEPLVTIINQDIDREIEEAKIQLAKAEDELKDLVAPDDQKRREQELKVAQNQQHMMVTQEQFDNLQATSPIDGVVVSLFVVTGDEVSSGQEIIVISNFAKNTMEIEVDELDINKLRFGQEAEITVDALPDVTLTGQVVGIAQEGSISEGVTKYPVTLEVGYHEGIKSGMTASATIRLENKQDVLRIPAEALVTENNSTMVRYLDNGQIRMKPIRIGVNNGRWVEVVEGLEEDEEIVLVAVTTQEREQNMRFGMPGMGMPPGGPPGGSWGRGGDGGAGFRDRGFDRGGRSFSNNRSRDRR